MLKNIKSTFVFAIMLCGLIAAYIFWQIEEHEDHDHDHHDHDEEAIVFLTSEQIEQANIEIREAQPGVVSQVICAPAKLIWNENAIAHVYPQPGGIAGRPLKNLGDTVTAGESLAWAESSDMAEAKAAYMTALKKEKLALTLLKQEKSLQDQGISAMQEYQNAASAAAEAHMASEVAKQKLYALGLSTDEIALLPSQNSSELRKYEIKAPIDGKILHRDFISGEQLKLESKVFIIGNLESLWAELKATPHELGQLEIGQPIMIRDGSGHTALASLLYVDTMVDADTGRVKAIAQLDNVDSKWLPGTFVTATAVIEETPVALVIAKEAIQKVDGQECAFISMPEGFEVRPVHVGRRDDQFVEVLSGIDSGEKYAATKTFLLKADYGKDEAEHID